MIMKKSFRARRNVLLTNSHSKGCNFRRSGVASSFFVAPTASFFRENDYSPKSPSCRVSSSRFTNSSAIVFSSLGTFVNETFLKSCFKFHTSIKSGFNFSSMILNSPFNCLTTSSLSNLHSSFALDAFSPPRSCFNFLSAKMAASYSASLLVRSPRYFE